MRRCSISSCPSNSSNKSIERINGFNREVSAQSDPGAAVENVAERVKVLDALGALGLLLVLHVAAGCGKLTSLSSAYHISSVLNDREQ